MRSQIRRSKPQDIQNYVRCAATYGVAVASRSGGHSYASYGVGGQNGSLVVDLSKLKSVSFDGRGNAKIQTGNRLGDIAQALWDNGQRALPHGTCPYVGSGGHAAFGGFGPFSRVVGLLHDHITAAEVVLADGTLTTASAKKNPELFWALRGAGASYGIATQWTYATLPAPPSVISYKISYDPLKAPQVRDQLIKWQDIALSAPDNLSVICTIGHGVFILGDNFYLEFRGTYYGTQIEFQALSSNWTSILSPGVTVSRTNNWYDSLVAISGPLSTNGTQPQQNFFYQVLVHQIGGNFCRVGQFVHLHRKRRGQRPCRLVY
ncbi:6-hydroxy-D-nicotine oxidase OS=Arthrobacter oxidans PE=1 SV=2 [Rhizoctonia solani AG-1 IB]|uniref:6-hydroxy-D-nicotine oxidase n=1 Tax=Thanatephorus cucumeris (strain AG1-IB / isolate 7/3/14) TaxID=1108050 RepID=A0A0B7F4N5_THACB|nr:6-hydroxy-D-nicotine oxidase OS=Arthrobacter oxidans PE=1 SV=2 [Rhizoctonia solani AG-1 IB]